MRFVPLHTKYIPSIIELADKEIGKDYYTQAELIEQIRRSTWKNKQLSFLAFDKEHLIGFRLTSAPGMWTHGRGKGLSPHLWPHALQDSAYFQSCFISNKYTILFIIKFQVNLYTLVISCFV